MGVQMAADPSTNFPNKKHDYVRIILDLKPEQKDDIVVGLLCNVLLQQRVNYELLQQLFRGLGLNISGFQKQMTESYYENESMRLSSFLLKFAKEIHLDPRPDADDKAGKP